ncbi:MAG: RagB/SusD family nutrient uptake outer membrane protein, partial [Bacteroidales bacterium]|nr:RagB/SusD family nutrient uptake outer membrane protein [Bacteroidales bacterium]
MKRIKILLVIAVIAGSVLLDACKESFLEITPKGSLDESVLATSEGVDGLLIGAYSMVDGVCDGFGWEAASSGWVFGSIRGMEANKGTDSGDQPDINPLQTYSETSTNPYLNIKWRSTYEGISRCNSTIVTAYTTEEAGTITSDEATFFIRQARALRGYYHFLAWKLWADR